MGVRRWIRHSLGGIEDHTIGAADYPDPRKHITNEIDASNFQKWVVFVAGVGFLTDAYDIFALNIVLPILEQVYYGGQMPSSTKIALQCSTLGGTLVGQLFSGFAADRFGRRKLYGVELIIILVATVGAAMSSSGVGNSMSFISWLLFWRVLMGVGIGMDYPLSAVITSEFAPRKHRSRMLAMLFFKQPLGQLLASLVSLIVLEIFRGSIPTNSATCVDPTCITDLDKSWRWITGLGAIPAISALFFRLTIPESPRFLMNVQHKMLLAARETQIYFGADRSSYNSYEVESFGGSDGHYPSWVKPAMSQMDAFEMRAPPSSHAGARVEVRAGNNAFATNVRHPPMRKPSIAEDERDASWADAKQYFLIEGNWKTLLGTTLTWFLMDIPFFGLGLSATSVLKSIWYSDNHALDNNLQKTLLSDVTHSLIIVSIGAVVGSILAIILLRKLSAKVLQMSGFTMVAALFLGAGIVFRYQQGIALIVLYVFIEVFFNFGPNTTTFMIPAEVFPTRYRCSCHGISAAAGKLGSILAQVILAYIKFNGESYSSSSPTTLGDTLLVFMVFMIFGAIATWFLIPNHMRDRSGNSRSLEDLSKGRDYLRDLHNEELHD